jgi:phosphoenolpyruvate carboxykinase (GTP)
VPAAGSLDLEGLDIPSEDLDELLRVDPAEWREELPSMHEHFAKFGDQLPGELREQLDTLEAKVGGGG